MLELESLATVRALEATKDGGLIMGDQVTLRNIFSSKCQRWFNALKSQINEACIEKSFSAYQWASVSSRGGRLGVVVNVRGGVGVGVGEARGAGVRLQGD